MTRDHVTSLLLRNSRQPVRQARDLNDSRSAALKYGILCKASEVKGRATPVAPPSSRTTSS